MIVPMTHAGCCDPHSMSSNSSAHSNPSAHRLSERGCTMKRASTVVIAALIVLLMSLVHAAVATAQLRVRRARCVVGQCFDVNQRVCTGQVCGPGAPCAAHQLCDVRARVCPCESPGGTVQTLGAQCTNATCDGRCVVAVPCTSPPCPAVLMRPGRCTGTAGNCECVPLPRPTPRPTPTPPCTGMPCEGECTICPPCLPGAVCPAFPCLTGTCQEDASGSCMCAPNIPATPTPRPTATPPCQGVPCEGACAIGFPCPFGSMCNGSIALIGSCTMTSSGCACVPPATPTPRPTATPACQSVPCEGACAIGFPCPLGMICNGPADRVGSCQMTSSGCVCVPPATPTPRATPTPACESAPCGGACAICPPCFPGSICPAAPCLIGTCVDSANAGCTCVPNLPPSPTPAPTCATDADCNDDDGCTVDHCVGGSCEHLCICATATGEPSCCGGPAALCVRACAADSAGTCGGACPGGGKCEILPGSPVACGCVSGAGGPCGGNVFAPPPVCAPGLVCQQSLPDATGVCVAPNCIALFASGCSQTSDCCEPCGNGTRPPCAVCLNGTCVGAP